MTRFRQAAALLLAYVGGWLLGRASPDLIETALRHPGVGLLVLPLSVVLATSGALHFVVKRSSFADHGLRTAGYWVLVLLLAALGAGHGWSAATAAATAAAELRTSRPG